MAAKTESAASTVAERPAIPDEAYHIHGIKKTMAALGLALVLFIAALDNTIVAVALPTIGEDLHNYQKTSWVVTAYFLTYTSFLPILSKLTDIVGRRPVLVASALFFALWSGACGGAKSMTQLIVFRALQGVGAAAIYSGVIVTMSTMVPKTELATFGSIIGAVFSVSNSIGPIIGGVIVQNIHWSWLFFINLPIALVGSVLIWFSVHDPDVARTWNDVARRVDWFGSLLILSFSLLLCTPLQLGGTVGYPWKSVSIIVPMILAGLIIPVFFWVESRHPEPVIPLRLFAIRNASVGILITMCIGAGFFLICIFLPQRMQVVNGLSPLNAGVRMLPLVALAGFMSMGVGILVRVVRNVRIPTWFGMILGSIGGGLLASMKVDTPYSTQVGFQVLVGVAFGFIIVLSTIAIQFSLDRKDLATAMGTQSFVRQIGGLIAIAVGTAFVNSQVNGAIDEKGLPAAILVAPEQVLKQLPPELLAVAREAYSTGFSRSFSEATAWFILGTFISFGLAHQVPDEFYVKAKGGDAETASPEDEVKATDPSRLSDEKHD